MLWKWLLCHIHLLVGASWLTKKKKGRKWKHKKRIWNPIYAQAVNLWDFFCIPSVVISHNIAGYILWSEYESVYYIR